MVRRAQGTSLNISACNATFTYIKREAVLIYFTNKGRIDIFDTKIQLSD
jgi:hypothetical protein